LFILDPFPPSTDHVTVWDGPLVPFTVAVNCCVPPLTTLVVSGLTLTPVTAGAGGGVVTGGVVTGGVVTGGVVTGGVVTGGVVTGGVVTGGVVPPPINVTFACPYLVVSKADVAFTVRSAALSPAGTVRMPSALMSDPFPPSTDQLTVCAGLFAPVTSAVNFSVSPLVTDGLGGLTVTPVTTGALDFGSVISVQALKNRAGITAASASSLASPPPPTKAHGINWGGGGDSIEQTFIHSDHSNSFPPDEVSPPD
jgi:hypothetical protein